MHPVASYLSERSALDNLIYKFLLDGGTMKELLQNVFRDTCLLSKEEFALLCKGDDVLKDPAALRIWIRELWDFCAIRMIAVSDLILRKYDHPTMTILTLNDFRDGVKNGQYESSARKDELIALRNELNQLRRNTKSAERLHQSTIYICKATWWFCILRCNGTGHKINFGNIFVKIDEWDTSIGKIFQCMRENNVEQAIQNIDAFLLRID